MVFTLYMKADFLYSDYVPEVCLFSGRTENLTTVGYAVSMPREAEPDEARMLLLQILVPLLGLIWLRSNSDQVSLPIPAARGAYGRWQWLRNGWWLGILALFAVPWVLPLALGPAEDSRLKMIWLVVTVGALLLATIAAFLAGRLTTPSIKMIGRKDIRLKFPASMKATYDAYLDGFFDYSQNQELVRKRVKTELNSKLKYTSDEDGETAELDETTPAEDVAAEGEATETDEAETDTPPGANDGETGEDTEADGPHENPPPGDHERGH